MDNWYKLRLAGLKNTLVLKLMKDFVSIEDVLKEKSSVLREVYGLGNEKVEELYRINDTQLEEEKERYDKHGVRIISYSHKEYPHLLKNTSSPPPFLYMKGKGTLSQKTVGVVGTRKMTREGMGACETIVKGLAKNGIDVVSGLALGVDAHAHKITLKNGGTPIAVVGNGLDIVYPPSNRSLYGEVEEKGLIMSELPLGVEPARWTFPQRNRIVAGLSRGILVVESYKSGGSLITAKVALDEGREVFAIPGMINYPSFEGCNELIKRGEAKLVNCIEDITEEFNWNCTNNKEKIKFEDATEEIIYNELITPRNLDELILKTGLKASDLLILLSNMELDGVIKSVSGGKFSRKE